MIGTLSYGRQKLVRAMMGMFKKIQNMGFVVMFLFIAIKNIATAEQVILSETKLPPVSAKLQNVSQVLTKIETPIIKNAQGLIAKGLHNVYVTVDSAAAYPLVVQGLKILPGETQVIAVNLSNSGGRLSIPIYPAVGKIVGISNYTAEIKDIKVSVCPEFFTESAVDCYRILMQPTLAVCPDGSSATSKTCSEVRTIAKQANCATGYINDEGVCEREILVDKTPSCDAGYATTW